MRSAPADHWPRGGLESVERCPVCGSDQRTLLYEGLIDRVFFCAPGSWTLHRCAACGSAYLDPRPTRATIGLAYERYFTHETTDVRGSVDGLSPLRRLRRALANGYLNARYGTDLRPATRIGRLAASLMPRKRAELDVLGRNLPVQGRGHIVLDVGCGNGDFLDFARRGGWHVMGVDPDPKAVETARQRGLDVRPGGLEVLADRREAFDVITASHVVEHVHDPLELLRSCHRLLKPGGFLWLETPNLDSLGHGRYRQAWLGLDPPRHLVLFTWRALLRALAETGFTRVAAEPHRSLSTQTFGSSEAIMRGLDPFRQQPHSLSLRLRAMLADWRARRRPGEREFITVRAWKKM